MSSILVTHTLHFVRGPDGHVYAPGTLLGRPFWSRYRTAGDRVTVAARVGRVDELPKDGSRADGDGVEFLDLADFRGPWQYFRCLRELRARLRGAIGSVDLFCLRAPCAIASIVWRELRRRRRPFGLEVVGDPAEALAPGSVRSLARPLARRSLSRDLRAMCQEACATAYVTRESLQRRYAPARDAFTTYFSSIDLPSNAVVDSPRSQLSDAPRLIFVGTLEVLYKAPDVLIRALARIGRPDLHLTVVGDGRRRESMEELAGSLGVSRQVTFTGHLPAGQAVRDALDRSDLFILPSRADGVPRAMIEAMARGLPCIGSTAGGIPELLAPEDLVPPGDEVALARRIVELLGDADRMRRMSERNLSVARQYGVDKLRPRREAFYRELRRRSGLG